MGSERIIIGADDERAKLLMRAIYAPFSRYHDQLLLMDTRSAELTRYAANAMLATRISLMNELARLAERVGDDIELVRHGIGGDRRIGTHFLYAGTGYGGSCFPKDVKALVRTGHEMGIDLRVLTAVEAANDSQKRVLVDKIVARFGEDLQGRCFALWGMAFKPDTDDMREAPSRVIVRELLRRGDPGLRPGGDGRSGAGVRRLERAEPCQPPGGRPADHHRVARVQEPGLRAGTGAAQAAADLRRSQPLRPGPGPQLGARVSRHRVRGSASLGASAGGAGLVEGGAAGPGLSGPAIENTIEDTVTVLHTVLHRIA